MAVQKIVYVTPAEERGGYLSPTAKSQLGNIVMSAFQGDGTTQQLTKVFRMTLEDAPLLTPSLEYLCNHTNKVSNNGEENLMSTCISDPKDIESIVHSTNQGEMAVIGVSRNELVDILKCMEKLGYDGYQRYSYRMGHPLNICAYTIDIGHKNDTSLHVARYK